MTRTFVHDGLRINVGGPDEDVAWLEEFLEPSFQTTSDGPVDATVSFESGGAPVAWEPDRTVCAFALDSGPRHLAACGTDSGLRLRDPTSAVVYDVSERGRSVRLRLDGNRLDARARLFRVVREFAHNHSLRTGGMILHAAAVEIGGAAVAIAGAKSAGKTTLALRMLMGLSAGYLSNDRVVVRNAGSPTALGIPTVVAIRGGTRALFPGLSARLATSGDFRVRAAARRDHGGMLEGATWRLGADQLCAAIGCTRVAGAPLAAVLFPSPWPDGRDGIRRLDHNEARAALRSALLCRVSGTYVSDVFVATDGAPPTAGELDARCDMVAATVPCVRVGYRAAETPARIAAYLQRELGLVRG